MIHWAIYSRFSRLTEKEIMQPMLHFFIGKGGVGKSTTSALTAIRRAEIGRRTLLVSLDPAHNQRDIFSMTFSSKPKQISENLSIQEIDVDRWVQSYLKQSIDLLKKEYAYQSAFNIQQHFNVLKFSPGLEGYALLLAFEDTLTRAAGMTDVIFDMPPTALTLQFFSLPVITRVWLQELLNLRTKIYERKAIISKIKWKSIEIEQDKVKHRLQSLIEANDKQAARFSAATTSINLVVNNEALSQSEAVRICAKLNQIDMAVSYLILNKCSVDDSEDHLNKELESYPIRRFPMSDISLTSHASLKRYLHKHPDL